MPNIFESVPTPASPEKKEAQPLAVRVENFNAGYFRVSVTPTTAEQASAYLRAIDRVLDAHGFSPSSNIMPELLAQDKPEIVYCLAYKPQDLDEEECAQRLQALQDEIQTTARRYMGESEEA